MISAGTDKTLSKKLQKEPGVYRWLFPADHSERPRAYVGEGEDLRSRISDYLKAAAKPVASASKNDFTEGNLRKAIKAVHRCSVIRIGEYLGRKAASRAIQLQKLRIDEEALICGIEISSRLLDDKIGRVLLEHWAILSTEGEGCTMLNRGRNTEGKELWKRLHPKWKSKTKLVAESWM